MKLRQWEHAALRVIQKCISNPFKNYQNPSQMSALITGLPNYALSSNHSFDQMSLE